MNGNAENVSMLLPETLDLAASEKFLELVRQRVSGDAPLRMDASAVRMLTLPCVQIVLAAIRSGEAITIKDPSAAFAGAFDDLGLDWMQYLDRSAERQQDQAMTERDQDSRRYAEAARRRRGRHAETNPVKPTFIPSVRVS